MVDSMMIGSNPVQDPTSNFAPHNPPLGQEYPLTTAQRTLKTLESVSRKLARAQHSLERTISDLAGAGVPTDALNAELVRVVNLRNVARVRRELQRDIVRDAALKTIADLKNLEA